MNQLPDASRFFIDGHWVQPSSSATMSIINPATEQSVGKVALAATEDVNKAVAAARAAFSIFSKWSVKDRLDLLRAINDRLIARNSDIAYAVNQSMGAPMDLAKGAQAGSGSQHFAETIRVLETYDFQTQMDTTLIRRDPIGVCALITPWNWPVNQVAAKVAPALAAGCTMILKPSEITPLDAVILAEIIDEAGAPPGVFNLIHGLGTDIGETLCGHMEVDMISFTGSTRAGIMISEIASRTVKRVSLELGGKSAAIILDDADLDKAIPACVGGVMLNTGQSCNACTRLLVPRAQYDDIAKRAADAANAIMAGTERGIGPLANSRQYGVVSDYIDKGISEGATLLAGGSERPDGLDTGYFIKPTIFGDVTPGMTIEREEIFGPVLTLTPYDNLYEAIEIANDSEYGLSGAVWGQDLDRANEVSSALRTGMVHINGAGLDPRAPFGGYKSSGNGREWGVYGLEEFLELKSVYGAKSKLIEDDTRG